MPAKDQAAYMREYRAKRKVGVVAGDPPPYVVIAILTNRVDELTTEVVRLKRELAARPERTVVFEGQGRPFVSYNPVPKPGK